MMGMQEYLRIHAHRLKGKKIVFKSGVPKEKLGAATFRGVPQGCNMSPTIAALCIESQIMTSHHDASLVMYADDGLIYGDDEASVLKFLNHLRGSALSVGSDIHRGKSRWIKHRGEFKGSFKFLGLKYDPSTPHQVSGQTRKGSNYSIPLVEIENYNFEGWESGRNFLRDISNSPRFLVWSKYRLLGTMMALMYNRGILASPTTRENSWQISAIKGSLMEMYEQEIVRKVARTLSIDVANVSSVSLRYVMYRLRKYNGRLTAKLDRVKRYKPSKAKNITKKLKKMF